MPSNGIISFHSHICATLLAFAFCADILSTAEAQTLPDPDGKPADMSQPVQVYILLGQSNMLGAGRIGPADKDGTLEHAVKEKKLYPYLVDDDGNWTERKDVRNVRVMGSGLGGMRQFNNEWMTVKGGTIGPEYGIGHHLGDAVDAPVLILKSCIGNRALGWDLLPPGSEGFEFTDSKGVTWVHPGYKGSPERWKKGEDPKRINWYAGMQYDGDIARAKKVLSEIDKYYPGVKTTKLETAKSDELKAKIAQMEDFARRARFTQEGLKKHKAEVAALRTELASLQAASRGYQVAGFFWWQGDRDSRSEALSSRYELNLVHLIHQLRKDFDAPNAKFVCASLGQTEKGATDGGGRILNAMRAVDGKSGKYPEFQGNVAAVYTHPLSKGGSSGGHYNGNSETYMNVGEAMGKAMVQLIAGKGLKLSYVSTAVLSSKQEKVVLELAMKRGIEDVAGISTHNIYPSTARGITVTGREKVNGREASTQVLHVRFKDWWHPGQGPRKGDIQIGDFWAGKPFTRKQTILKVGEKEYRTGSVQGLSIEESESVLSLLIAGEYSVGDSVRKGTLEQIDWNKPQFIRKGGELVSVGFLHQGGSGSGFFDLQIKQIDEKLTIEQVFQAVP